MPVRHFIRRMRRHDMRVAMTTPVSVMQVPRYFDFRRDDVFLDPAFLRIVWSGQRNRRKSGQASKVRSFPFNIECRSGIGRRRKPLCPFFDGRTVWAVNPQRAHRTFPAYSFFVGPTPDCLKHGRFHRGWVSLSLIGSFSSPLVARGSCEPVVLFQRSSADRWSMPQNPRQLLRQWQITCPHPALSRLRRAREKMAEH